MGRPNIDLFETTSVFVPYLAYMDIDPLQYNKITTKLIWLIDHSFYFWIPSYIWKKMEIRSEILRFLLRVHLATSAINAPMSHEYHSDVCASLCFQDYELFYKSGNKFTCASCAVYQILLMLLFCTRPHTLSYVKKFSSLILNQYLSKVSYTDLYKILTYRECWQN